MSTLDSSSANVPRTSPPDPPPPSHIDVGDTDVSVVRWPEDLVLRDALAAVGRARLLLVRPGVEPPADLDECEDWVRWPSDSTELALRASHLVRRIGRRPVEPVELDSTGVLRRGERWATITDAQLPILRVLLDHLDRVVRFDDLMEAYAAGGGSRHPASVRTVLSRLGERVRPVGLTLTTVRRRGYVLQSADRATGPIR